MKTFRQIQEAAYAGNVGFEEMVLFYRKANKKMQDEMDMAVDKGDKDKVWELFFKVLGIRLR